MSERALPLKIDKGANMGPFSALVHVVVHKFCTANISDELYIGSLVSIVDAGR